MKPRFKTFPFTRPYLRCPIAVAALVFCCPSWGLWAQNPLLWSLCSVAKRVGARIAWWCSSFPHRVPPITKTLNKYSLHSDTDPPAMLPNVSYERGKFWQLWATTSPLLPHTVWRSVLGSRTWVRKAFKQKAHAPSPPTGQPPDKS